MIAFALQKDRRKLENELLKATDEVEELKKEVELGKRIEEGMKVLLIAYLLLCDVQLLLLLPSSHMLISLLFLA